MPRLRPIHRALLPILVSALAACSSPSPSATPTVGPTPTTTPTFDIGDLPDCDYPERIEMPSWIPDDLPFPPGTYAAEKLSAVQGYKRVLLVAQTTLAALQRFALDRLPQEGWVVGRGDTEPGEVDLQFSKPPAVGAFRAIDQFCNPGFVLILVIYTPDAGALVAPVPITPAPGSTPIGG
ncbi:MAG TPA: hypothetical protein VGB51_05655 [Actinomycetota bacterium]